MAQRLKMELASLNVELNKVANEQEVLMGKDEPEGKVTVTLSLTLTRQIADLLLEAAHELP